MGAITKRKPAHVQIKESPTLQRVIAKAKDNRFAYLQEVAEREMVLAAAFAIKNPTLGFVSCYLLANNYAVAELYDKAFRNNEIDWQTAAILMGSYARFDYLARWWDAGRIKTDELLKDLCDLWRGSDPDDTDVRFKRLFRAAYEVKGIYLRDKKALPRDKYITIYHGQDRIATKTGIAWTLDRTIAVKFARGAWARQGDRDGIVLQATIPSHLVIAYITGRGEEEVIVDPAQFTYERTEI